MAQFHFDRSQFGGGLVTRLHMVPGRPGPTRAGKEGPCSPVPDGQDERVEAFAARAAAGEDLWTGAAPAASAAPQPGPAGPGKPAKKTGLPERGSFAVAAGLFRPAGVVEWADLKLVNCGACGALLLGPSWEWVRAAVTAATRKRLPVACVGLLGGRPACAACKGEG